MATGMAGVDTASFQWHPPPDKAPRLWAALAASCHFGQLPSGVPVQRLSNRRYRFADPASGIQWFIDQRWWTIYCEGRLAPMLGLDPELDTLADFGRLAESARRQAERFTELAADYEPTRAEPPGYVTMLDRSLNPVPQRDDFLAAVAALPRRQQRYYLRPVFDLADYAAVVRRLDYAAEVHFADGGDGLASLGEFAEVAASTRKGECWSAHGRVETVYLRRGEQRLFRIYDSGTKRRVEGRGDDPPGVRLRFERQRRWKSGRRPRPETLQRQDPAKLWGEDLAKVLPLGSQAITVSTPEGLARELARRAEAGEMTAETAERLAGFVAITSQRGSDWWHQLGRAQVGYRRVRALRELGLVRARSTPRAAAPRAAAKPLPLRAVMQAVAGAWVAANRRRRAAEAVDPLEQRAREASERQRGKPTAARRDGDRPTKP